MKNFNPEIESRIRNLSKHERAIVTMFREVAQEMEESGNPSSTLVIPLYDEGSKLTTGDLAPEIHLVVRTVA